MGALSRAQLWEETIGMLEEPVGAEVGLSLKLPILSLRAHCCCEASRMDLGSCITPPRDCRPWSLMLTETSCSNLSLFSRRRTCTRMVVLPFMR